MEDDLLAAMMDFDVRLAPVAEPCSRRAGTGGAIAASASPAHDAGLPPCWDMLTHCPALRSTPQDPAPPAPRTGAPMPPGGLPSLRLGVTMLAVASCCVPWPLGWRAEVV